jgi:hypothetical protein
MEPASASSSNNNSNNNSGSVVLDEFAGVALISPWGWRSKTKTFHEGWDLAIPSRTQLFAPTDCRVAFSGRQTDDKGRLAGYGNYTVLRLDKNLNDHNNGVYTLYGHLTKDSVRPGQFLKRGQEFALSGNSGHSSGPHVHYEMWVVRNGVAYPVNPASAKGKNLLDEKVQDGLIAEVLEHEKKNQFKKKGLKIEAGSFQNTLEKYWRENNYNIGHHPDDHKGEEMSSLGPKFRDANTPGTKEEMTASMKLDQIKTNFDPLSIPAGPSQDLKNTTKPANT